MNITKRLLLLILLLLILIGCQTAGNNIIVEPQPVYCPQPPRPVLVELDGTKPISETTNLKSLLNTLADLVDYSLKLEAAVRCYVESQPKSVLHGTLK